MLQFPGDAASGWRLLASPQRWVGSMAGHEHPSRPRILLARGGPWPRGSFAVAIPPDVPPPPIDLDLRVRPLPWQAAPAVAPTSVWLSSGVLDMTVAAVVSGLRGQVGDAVPGTIAVDIPPDGDAHQGIMAHLDALAGALAGETGPPRVALGMRSTRLVGGRRHLATLTAIRRLAEEWNLGIALDLTGGFDPQWEAEAAIVRLGKRLVLLRVGSRAIGLGPIDRDRVARRAVRAAIERCPDLSISIEPTLPWWQVFASDERGRTWLESEERLRSWLAPPPADDRTGSDQTWPHPSWRSRPPI